MVSKTASSHREKHGFPVDVSSQPLRVRSMMLKIKLAKVQMSDTAYCCRVISKLINTAFIIHEYHEFTLILSEMCSNSDVSTRRVAS